MASSREGEAPVVNSGNDMIFITFLNIY